MRALVSTMYCRSAGLIPLLFAHLGNEAVRSRRGVHVVRSMTPGRVASMRSRHLMGSAVLPRDGRETMG
jgi:hypothetical protein